MPSSRRYSTLSQCLDAKPEARNPKPERRPKPEVRKRHYASARCCLPVFRTSDFGLRPSFGLRASAFGLPPPPVMTISELLESVRRIEVRTNRLVNDTMVG